MVASMEGDGKTGEKKVKGKIANNIVITLNGDKWVLGLVSRSHHKVYKC